MSSDNTDLLRIVDLRVYFGGVHAVDGVSITIEEEEGIVGLVGPNGSGKTTLFNAITGIVEPDTGHVYFCGRSMAGLPMHEVKEAGIARTFQSLRIFPQMTVWENVMVGLQCKCPTGVIGALLRTPGMRQTEEEIRQTAFDCMSFFGPRLTDWRDQPAESLSYANRRRLELARAMAARPRLLLADEPSAGMNTGETKELGGQLLQMSEMGMKIFVIEHNMDLVTDVCKRVIVLNQGRVIAEGSPEEVKGAPEVVRAYLGE